MLLCSGEVGAQFKPSSAAFPVTGWTSTNIGPSLVINVLLSHFLAGVAASSASSRISGGWASACAGCAGADLPRIRRPGGGRGGAESMRPRFPEPFMLGNVRPCQAGVDTCKFKCRRNSGCICDSVSLSRKFDCGASRTPVTCRVSKSKIRHTAC